MIIALNKQENKLPVSVQFLLFMEWQSLDPCLSILYWHGS